VVASPDPYGLLPELAPGLDVLVVLLSIPLLALAIGLSIVVPGAIYVTILRRFVPPAEIAAILGGSDADRFSSWFVRTFVRP
jgi:hypothetical protein